MIILIFSAIPPNFWADQHGVITLFFSPLSPLQACNWLLTHIPQNPHETACVGLSGTRWRHMYVTYNCVLFHFLWHLVVRLSDSLSIYARLYFIQTLPLWLAAGTVRSSLGVIAYSCWDSHYRDRWASFFSPLLLSTGRCLLLILVCCLSSLCAKRTKVVQRDSFGVGASQLANEQLNE